MKGTLWLWLAGMALVCVTLQVSALPYSDTRVVQDNSLLSLKRTKPSLSIVNPLDVLRQRIILEMARRQMRENTRQVELNKALLREIGKRSSNFYDTVDDPLEYAYYDRKPYNHRVAPDAERSPAEDELETMVESLLRGSHLALREANHQRIRSVNDRQQGAAAGSHPGRNQDPAALTPLSPAGSAPNQAQKQPQQLENLFNNEPETIPSKNDAYQERERNADDGQPDEDGDGLAGGSSGTQKGFLDASQTAPAKLRDAIHSTGNDDRNSENEFRPRYVYGMYKNRYAN